MEKIQPIVLFDAMKITKYWRNQIPPHDLSSPFTDSYFPPNTNSLHGLTSTGEIIDPVNGPVKSQEIDPEMIEWKRIHEVMPEAKIFEDKIEFDDVKQGFLGNCYFLSAVSSLTEFPYLIYQIFRSKKENPLGYYEMVFFIDGEWQIVFVDDYFAFEKGSNNFKFARPNGLELWVILLEKAWAKLNGGYNLTISGYSCDPLASLTGFPTEMFYMNEQLSVNDLWEKLSNLDKINHIMCASTRDDKNFTEKFGLVNNHAYTLSSVKEYDYQGQNIRLVRLRNPWGYKEWFGDWSDNSSLWDDELKKVFNLVSADDGAFYISIEDFLKFFSWSYICHVMYDCNIKSFSLNGDSLNKPQVFNLYVDKESKIAISLIFRHWRFNRHLIDKEHPATILIGRYDENYKIVYVDGVYSANKNLEFAPILKKGYYVIWLYVCTDICDPVPDQAVFRLYSTNEFKFLNCGSDPNFIMARKIILEGVKEMNAWKYNSEVGYYCVVDSEFMNSGIGFCAFFNNHNDKYFKQECDLSKIENMYILPPFNGKIKFDRIIPPNYERIILSMRMSQKILNRFQFDSTTECIEELLL